MADNVENKVLLKCKLKHTKRNSINTRFSKSLSSTHKTKGNKRAKYPFPPSFVDLQPNFAYSHHLVRSGRTQFLSHQVKPLLMAMFLFFFQYSQRYNLVLLIDLYFCCQTTEKVK